MDQSFISRKGSEEDVKETRYRTDHFYSLDLQTNTIIRLEEGKVAQGHVDDCPSAPKAPSICAVISRAFLQVTSTTITRSSSPIFKSISRALYEAQRSTQEAATYKE